MFHLILILWNLCPHVAPWRSVISHVCDLCREPRRLQIRIWSEAGAGRRVTSFRPSSVAAEHLPTTHANSSVCHLMPSANGPSCFQFPHFVAQGSCNSRWDVSEAGSDRGLASGHVADRDMMLGDSLSMRGGRTARCDRCSGRPYTSCAWLYVWSWLPDTMLIKLVQLS